MTKETLRSLPVARHVLTMRCLKTHLRLLSKQLCSLLHCACFSLQASASLILPELPLSLELPVSPSEESQINTLKRSPTSSYSSRYSIIRPPCSTRAQCLFGNIEVLPMLLGTLSIQSESKPSPRRASCDVLQSINTELPLATLYLSSRLPQRRLQGRGCHSLTH